MSEEEQKEFDDNVKTLSLQLRLFAPQLKEHQTRLEAGTAKMHELEIALKDLRCGEHEIEMEHFREHIRAGDKWRMAIFTIAIGLVVSIVGTIQTWGAIQEKISNLERVTYETRN